MTTTGIEMQSLLKASRSHLPEAIVKYRKVITGLDETDEQVGKAFKDDGLTQMVRQRWEELRDVVRFRLEGTIVSLDDTAEALDQVVIAFVHEDRVLAREVAELARRNGLPPP